MLKLEKMIKKIKENKYIIVCLILCVFICLPIVKNYINGDDTFFHLLNIEMYSKSSIFSKILPGANYNMGSGVGIFYPCLPHALGGVILKVISHINLNAIWAIKIVKGIILLLSMITMYITAKVIYKDKRKAMFASLFYISSSYFYVDMFTRDALNESALFIFIPLIFLSFYYIFKENNRNKFMILFIIGYVGMLYSHLVMTVFFTLLLIPFLLIYIKDIFKKDNLIAFIVSSIIILVLTSTFTIPLMEHMHANKWNLPFKGNWVLPLKDYLFESLFKTSANGLLYINLHYIVVILAVLAVYSIYKNKKDENRKYLFGLFIFTSLSILISGLTIFWKHAPEFFQTIQFAWRLTTYSVFGISLLAVNGLDKLFSIFNKKYIWVCSLYIIILLFVFTGSHYKNTKFTKDIKYNNKSLSTAIVLDYLPSNTFKNLGYLKERDNNTIIGDAETKIIKNDTPYLKFKVSNIKDKTTLELPRLYYLGYTITDNKGNIIEYKENKYGFITVNVSNGIYEVKYTGSVFYKTAVVIKSILILLLILFGIYKCKKTV